MIKLCNTETEEIMAEIQKIAFRNVSRYVKAKVFYNALPPFYLLQFCELPALTESDFHCVVHNTVVVMLSGEILFRTPAGQELTGRRGELILLPGNAPYLWRTGVALTKTFQGGYLITDGYNFSNLSPFLSFNDGKIRKILLEKTALPTLEKELDEAEQSEFPAFYGSLALFRLLGEAFHSACREDSRSEHAEIQRYLHYVESHLHTDISVEDLMKVGNVSRRKLFLQFREFIGMSPLQYIARQKIRLAIRMIESRRLDSAAIAKELGFSSVNYFIRFFRKHTGTTPAAMRRERFLPSARPPGK